MFIKSMLKKVYGKGKEDKKMDIDELQKLINEILPGVTLFVRDADLPPEIVAQYKVGEIIREKGFTDASCRVGGMVTSHRYAILSNHMGDFQSYEHGTNWGLFVAQHDAHFKVLDVYEYQGKTQITLLHLPDDDRWKMFENVELTIEADLISKCREYLEKSCMKEVISELATGEWLDRCRLPLGIYDMRISLESAIKFYTDHQNSDAAIYMVFSALAKEKIFLPTNKQGGLLSLSFGQDDMIPLFTSEDQMASDEPVQLRACYIKDFIDAIRKTKKHLIINPFSEEDIRFVIPYEAIERMLIPVLR